MPVLRKWYFCINERGFEPNLPNIKAAVMSARANTGLAPHCLYFGENPHHRNILIRLGVTVIDHSPSLADALRQGYGDKFDIFSGHWLRVDLPLVEQDEEFVLYTDVDVMFLQPPELQPLPRVLAAAPEFRRSNWRTFSSGVMVLNLPRLRALHDDFVAAIRARLTGNFRYPAHDQASYNQFFGATLLNRLRGRARERMAPEMNWKPFWGIRKAARIVHFHGPKPPTVRVLESGKTLTNEQTLIDLWNRDRQAYAHYSGLWEDYESAGQRLLQSFL